MMDRLQAIERAAVLDIAPATLMYAHTNREFGTKYLWWVFHIQPAPVPCSASLLQVVASSRK